MLFVCLSVPISGGSKPLKSFMLNPNSKQILWTYLPLHVNGLTHLKEKIAMPFK
jgi:hypothetical protein